MNAIEQIFGPAPVNPATAPKKELGQEDFLKLLVAQLKNQDPNNPADNGEFLGQIAQFSMVSGIDDLGNSFDSIASSLFTGQAMQATQLVGKEVLIETDRGILAEGAALEGVLELGDDALTVRLQIHDAAGALVTVVELGNLPAGSQKFSWDGLDAAGNPSAAGEYVVTAEGFIDGTLTGLPLQIFNKVESVSVDRSSTNILLHLATDQSVGISQIREFR